MATIKVRWHVNELVNVMSLFDVQKVYRSTIDSPYSWTEITDVSTRVPLVAGQTDYLFDDIAGDITYFYCVSYFNSTSSIESRKSDPINGNLAGYISLGEVRAEGFTETKYSDARVLSAIEMASDLIDNVTGQWFEPRTRTFSFDIKGSPKGGSPELSLDVPIIAMTAISIYGTDTDIDNFLVYNRHLRQGLLNPDDRHDPKIKYNYDYDYRITNNNLALNIPKGSLNVTVTGVWGYTDINANDPIGVTVEGGQIPLSYGHTPPLIKRAALLLMSKFLPKVVTGGSMDSYLAGRVIEEKTRDQNYRLAVPTDRDKSYGMTGNVEVDNILLNFMAPLGVGVV